MMIDELTTFTTGDWRQSPDYATVLEHLQRAEWAEAVALLTTLLQDYPDEAELQSLLDETQLRLETEHLHQGPQGRRIRINQRVVFVVALVGVLAALGFLALNLYRWVITPAMERSQSAALQAVVAEQAQQALAVGDYDRSLAIWNQLAGLNPSNPKLVEGRAQAEQAKTLAETYDLAMDQLGAGALTDAQATLETIRQMSPNYRDVPALLARIERQQRYNGLVGQAVAAIDARNWEEVVARLEAARALAGPTERASLDADLFDAYLNLGAQIVDGSQGRLTDMERALDLYNKALALRPQHPQATTQRGYAKAYLTGSDAIKNSDWEGAIIALEPLYSEQPGYLNGEPARLLYNAYMRSGDTLYAENEPDRAWERYSRASQIKGVDTTTAKALATNLAVYVTPTPTPLPPPTATPVPLAMRASVATPAPAYVPLNRYKDKIAYLSTRSGAQAIWVMDGDGKNPFMPKDQVQASEEYQKLREAENRAPDGQNATYVTTPPDEQYPQIFVAHADNTASRITDLAGMNSDPVWSPKGYWIAFVSNQPGNDEIFIVGADGKGLKRLTNDTFEWDKHPSWSPDGSRLVFWSNRATGHPQIWTTAQDGSGQANLSNNEFDERDPVWIK
jgi:tetratricopeptide (TPR) repeat protein